MDWTKCEVANGIMKQNADSCPQGTNNLTSWILCMSTPQPGIFHYRCPQYKRIYNVQLSPRNASSCIDE